MIREATLDDREVLAQLIRDSFRDVARRFSLTQDNCLKHRSNCDASLIASDFARGAWNKVTSRQRLLFRLQFLCSPLPPVDRRYLFENYFYEIDSEF